jgi:hypothetical protein
MRNTMMPNQNRENEGGQPTGREDEVFNAFTNNLHALLVQYVKTDVPDNAHRLQRCVVALESLLERVREDTRRAILLN